MAKLSPLPDLEVQLVAANRAARRLEAAVAPDTCKIAAAGPRHDAPESHRPVAVVMPCGFEDQASMAAVDLLSRSSPEPLGE